MNLFGCIIAIEVLKKVGIMFYDRGKKIVDVSAHFIVRVAVKEGNQVD